MAPNAIQWGGRAAIATGVLYAGQGFIDLVAPQRAEFSAASDYAIEILFIAALVGTLVAIAGLQAVQHDNYGRTGVFGAAVAFIGHACMLVGATATAWAGHDVLDGIFVLGILGALIGLVVLGVATLRAGVLPRWCGVLLIAGLPVSSALEAFGGGVVLGAAWAMVGYALLAAPIKWVSQPARAV